MRSDDKKHQPKNDPGRQWNLKPVGPVQCWKANYFSVHWGWCAYISYISHQNFKAGDVGPPLESSKNSTISRVKPMGDPMVIPGDPDRHLRHDPQSLHLIEVEIRPKSSGPKKGVHPPKRWGKRLAFSDLSTRENMIFHSYVSLPEGIISILEIHEELLSPSSNADGATSQQFRNATKIWRGRACMHAHITTMCVVYAPIWIYIYI